MVLPQTGSFVVEAGRVTSLVVLFGEAQLVTHLASSFEEAVMVMR